MEHISNQLEISLLKNLYTSERPQKILQFLLSRYGVMEVEKLYRIFCVLLGAPLKYEIFEASYLAGLLQTRYCYYYAENQTNYLSVYKKAETKKILEERRQFPQLNYPYYSVEEINHYIENGFFCDSEAYVQLEKQFRGRRGLKKESKEYILKYIARNGALEKTPESILKNIRRIWKDHGSRMTKETQLLIAEAARQMPIAAKFGWTNVQYQKLEEEQFTSMQTITCYQQDTLLPVIVSAQTEKNWSVPEKKAAVPVKKKKKEIQGQMSLFDFFGTEENRTNEENRKGDKNQ